MGLDFTGKDDDYLGKKKDGLKFLWRWGWYGAYDKSPGQVCGATFKDYQIQAVAWANDYEAGISNRYNMKDIVTKEGFKTRLEAQKAAEQLLLEYLKKQAKWYKKLVSLMDADITENEGG